MVESKKDYEVKAIRTAMFFQSLLSDEPKKELPKLDNLDHAEGWLIAQVRGNNKESDNKVIHIVCDLIEDHFKFQKYTTSGAKTRLNMLTDKCDSMDERGRACVLAAWGIRQKNDELVWKCFEKPLEDDNSFYGKLMQQLNKNAKL